MKPLLVILRPRDIEEFLESQKYIKIDKLWINYYPQTEAFEVAREQCLASDYTHFIFIVDDNIITQNHIDTLLNDCNRYGYDLISGWMNNNTTTHKDDSNISESLPPDPPNQGLYEGYNFMSISRINDLSNDVAGLIIPVKHQGFALTLMSREILEQIPFRDSYGCCTDSCFSLDLDKAGIKQYVDLRVRCKHLKVNDENQKELLQVGNKPKEIVKNG